MKLSDPSFLNMDKILKNLSDFMKKISRRDAGSQGEQKPEIGTRMAEINFARESARKEGRNAAPSGAQISETDTAFRTKPFSHEGEDAPSQGVWCV